jgi:tRNA(Ile)-lysidine synthase TilS/MesJ
MHYSVTWEIQIGDTKLPLIFVRKKDAVAYATEHNITDYQIIRDSEF